MWPGTLVALLCAVPSLAADPLAPLLACRTITDAAARLECYDRESATLTPATAAAATTSPAPTPAASPPTPAAAAVPAAAAPAAAVASAGSTPATPSPAAPSPKAAAENFGLPEGKIAAQEVAAGTRAPELTRITAQISAVSLSGSGRATFTLDNGQVWQQLQSEGDLLARAGDPVTISRGWLGSHWLELRNGRGCKVTRIH